MFWKKEKKAGKCLRYVGSAPLRPENKVSNQEKKLGNCLKYGGLLWFILFVSSYPAITLAGYFPAPKTTDRSAVFLGNFSISGLPAQPGDEVAFFDPQGVLSGLYVVDTAGAYGMVAVYGDDPITTETDEGAKAGDVLTIKMWDSRSGAVLEGDALLLSGGASPSEYFQSSSVPPVWQENLGFILNIDTSTHFPKPGANPWVSNYIVSLTINGAPAAFGDEIAVFDPDGILAGLYIVGQDGPLDIYGDDPDTPSIDEGVAEGDVLTFKVWIKSAGSEYDVNKLILSPGEPMGEYYISSSIPPVWTKDTGYVLNIEVTEDATAPQSSVTSPVGGTTIIGPNLLIFGEASDIGSQVQRVEVSTDGGATWHPAEGTTNWSYDWTFAGDGTFTIKSRAIDEAGNVEAPGPGVTVVVYKREPSIVKINGRQLLLNGEPFIVRGVGYSPVPIGDDPETTPPYGDYFTSGYSAIYNRDLPQLREMKTNSIRLWNWATTADHRDFLDKAFNEGSNPIYVIAGFWINPGQDIDPASPNNVREQLKAAFRAMVAAHKNYPALLMWSIGNELNADWMYGGNPDHLFSLLNEMAEEAHAEEGADYHPVTTALMDKDLINTIAAHNATVPSLDLWGANVYRGNTFGNLFTDYQAASDKPLIILEYGIDAYDKVHGTEYEYFGRPYQAEYAEALWKEIAANSDVAIGGSIMAYSDEWWKGKHSTDPGCPETLPSFHGTCGYASSSHPDGYANEEWWGLMRIKDNGTEPDIVKRRAVFYSLQALWAGVVRGDIDNDGMVDLKDALLALQLLAGMNPPGIRSDYAASMADVNGDNRIGLAEVVYILQKLAAIR